LGISGRKPKLSGERKTVPPMRSLLSFFKSFYCAFAIAAEKNRITRLNLGKNVVVIFWGAWTQNLVTQREQCTPKPGASYRQIELGDNL
jgi:hypothetical protein